MFDRTAHRVRHDQKITIHVAAGDVEPDFPIILPIINNFIGQNIPKNRLGLLKRHPLMFPRIYGGLLIVPGKLAIAHFY